MMMMIHLSIFVRGICDGIRRSYSFTNWGENRGRKCSTTGVEVGVRVGRRCPFLGEDFRLIFMVILSPGIPEL